MRSTRSIRGSASTVKGSGLGAVDAQAVSREAKAATRMVVVRVILRGAFGGVPCFKLGLNFIATGFGQRVTPGEEDGNDTENEG